MPTPPPNPARTEELLRKVLIVIAPLAAVPTLLATQFQPLLAVFYVPCAFGLWVSYLANEALPADRMKAYIWLLGAGMNTLFFVGLACLLALVAINMGLDLNSLSPWLVIPFTLLFYYGAAAVISVMQAMFQYRMLREAQAEEARRVIQAEVETGD